eukprot:Skav233638  [mRNA]  locus=scaffold2779:274589:277955:+ [translate_table: standard]
MADVLEPLLPMICSYSSLPGVLSLAAVWIQCSRSRWSFGALFQVPGDVAPGARDEACLTLWQRSDKEVCRLLSEAVSKQGGAAENIFTRPPGR